MYEYEVRLVNGFAVVYADEWYHDNKTIYFKREGAIVKRYRFDEAVSIQRVWPELGPIWIKR